MDTRMTRLGAPYGPENLPEVPVTPNLPETPHNATEGPGPAVEAAQRAWVERYGEDQLPRFYEKCAEDEDVAAFITAAAREALRPIRELHQLKVAWLTEDAYCEHCGRNAGWPCATARLVYSAEELNQ